ncbi:hypothetical protein EDB81DRAFT_898304 [Dactylonectria macrodidyma]|uniref:SET domain-containing protein n=1 Tax=Dactylonectria macrodidyma TaxID=307937 RepID=A0A9P9FWX7_9HYPO|nr:hypothetical protein EDB81DRAFT_898304 [Dactylonectria macrodidyma]
MSSWHQVATSKRPEATHETNAQDADFYLHPSLVPDQDPYKGRLLRASAAVPAGTVLLVDAPYAVVPAVEPMEKHHLICSNLVCSRRVKQDGKGSRCLRNCIKDVVWCNDACRAADCARHEFECLWLKQNGATLRREEGEYNFLTLWHVVRVLAARDLELHRLASNPPRRYAWEGEFKRGWASIEMCCAYLDSWPEAQIEHWKRLTERYLSDASTLPCLLTPDELLLIICKEETNTFGLYPKMTGPLYMIDHPVPRGLSYGMGIYPRAAMFNHSCLPNVTHKPNDNARMVYTSARDIAAGEECCITYFDLTAYKDLASRQQMSESQFQFSCTCERCVQEGAQENIDGMGSLPFGDFFD